MVTTSKPASGGGADGLINRVQASGPERDEFSPTAQNAQPRRCAFERIHAGDVTSRLVGKLTSTGATEWSALVSVRGWTQPPGGRAFPPERRLTLPLAALPDLRRVLAVIHQRARAEELLP